MAEVLEWEEESRFSRFSLISWWEQERLRSAKILVVGAGALGNEIVKNLALLGVGNLVVVDMDSVERSNLSRSALFRERDIGMPKAEILCSSARDLFPGINAVPMTENILHGVGIGVFRWADVIIGGLDNREARLALSRTCNLVGRPWIDGAIDVLAGIVRVFVPGDGACYECTLSEADWTILDQRRACSLLPRDSANLEPRVPTTPTTSSVIAGIQCSEAIKLLHGIEGLKNSGFQFDARNFDCYTVNYRRDPECYGHDCFDEILESDSCSQNSIVVDVLGEIDQRFGPGAIVEAPRELVCELKCDACGKAEAWHGALDSLNPDIATCPHCSASRSPKAFHRIHESTVSTEMALRELGIPAFDILRIRLGDRLIGFELSGDRNLVCGLPIGGVT